MTRNLTLRYSIYQLLFFSITAGTGGFAATYLLGKGFSSAQIGLILAATNVASCCLQPLLGSAVDRAKGFVLPRLLGLMAGTSALCFALLILFDMGKGFQGALYVLGSLTLAIMPSLSNSLCAYYTERNCAINFGVGAGIGSLAYSTASLGIGYLIAWRGTDAMILLVLVLLAILFWLVLSYPKVSGEAPLQDKAGDQEMQSSLFRFALQYRSFSVTILGVLLIAMCHAMAENYLINLFEPMGGGSENVGTALFIACVSAVPFLMLFDRVQAKVGVENLMRLAGLFYILKAFFLYRAATVTHVYLTVLLQFCSYGFLFPSLYYFAKKSVSSQDMAKGQTMAMSLYTLGLALGSYVGGYLIQAAGVRNMLLGAMLFAGEGMLIVNSAVGRKRNPNPLR